MYCTQPIDELQARTFAIDSLLDSIYDNIETSLPACNHNLCQPHSQFLLRNQNRSHQFPPGTSTISHAYLSLSTFMVKSLRALIYLGSLEEYKQKPLGTL